MEQTRSIAEIPVVVIRQGFLALTPFHYLLKEWELTKAGQKAKKEEMKRKKKDKKSKLVARRKKQKEFLTSDVQNYEDDHDTAISDFCKGIIQEACIELHREEEANVISKEEQEKLAVSEFCRGLILQAINEIRMEGAQSNAAYITTTEEQEKMIVPEFCRGLILGAIKKLHKEDMQGIEASSATKEGKEAVGVAEFRQGVILGAIGELVKEEGHSTEACINTVEPQLNLEEEIKLKIESLERGEGDIGRAVTPTDLVKVKDDGTLPDEAAGDDKPVEIPGIQSGVQFTSGDLEHYNEISLVNETPIGSGHSVCTGIETESTNKEEMRKSEAKIAKKKLMAERKRTEKEKKERQKKEKEQIKATKKYFKMIDEAMDSRSIVLKLFWEKTLEEKKIQQKKEKKVKEQLIKKEKKEQKTLVERINKEDKSKAIEDKEITSINANPADLSSASQNGVLRGESLQFSETDDELSKHVTSDKDVVIQTPAKPKEEKKRSFRSRVMGLFVRFFTGPVF